MLPAFFLNVHVSASRFIAIVAVFALLGPPIGTVLFALLVLAAGTAGLFPEGTGYILSYGALLLLPLSYMIAGLQALVTGLVTALWIFRRTSAPWFVPVGAALLAGIVDALKSEPDLSMQAVLLAVHAGTALICWLIARQL